MYPSVQEGDVVWIEPLVHVQVGDIVLARTNGGHAIVHRVVRVSTQQGARLYQTRGDACPRGDRPIAREQLLGRVVRIERTKDRRMTEIRLDSAVSHWVGWLWATFPRLSRRFARILGALGCRVARLLATWRSWGAGAKSVLVALLFSSLLLLPPSSTGSARTSDRDNGYAPPCGSDICVVESDAAGLTLEVHLGPFSVSKEKATAQGTYDLVQVAGWSFLDEAGSPHLPAKYAMIGVPLQADLQIEVHDVEARQLAGTYRIPPAPQPAFDPQLPASPDERTLVPLYRGEIRSADPDRYEQNALYPGTYAQIVDEGFIRHQRVATIALTPFQYNPASGRVWVSERYRVRIRFAGPPVLPSTDEAVEAEPGEFEDLLARSLLNYPSARQWRGRGVSGHSYQTWDPPVPGYKVIVEQDGMVQLTYDDLLAANLPVSSIDPRTFQIFVQGVEAAIYVHGQGDGVFGAGDYILFYGLNPRSKYTDRNVYWLTYGAQQGRRMDARDGSLAGGHPEPVSSPRSKHLEGAVNYYSQADGGDELERWFWGYVYPPWYPNKKYRFDLPVLPAGMHTATLHVTMYGGFANPINPDHHTEVYVNNHLVEDAWWDGIGWRVSEANFPQSYLQDGANEIRVEGPNDSGVGYDFVMVDQFTLDYWGGYVAHNDQLAFSQDVTGTWAFRVTDFYSPNIRAFDITEPLSVTQIVNLTVDTGLLTNTLRFQDTVVTETQYLALSATRYLTPTDIIPDAPSSLRSPGNGADYIVISHADFYTQAAVLADYRAKQGKRTAAVDVADVYDEFSFGLVDPKAIRSFLAYAYESWAPPAPAYVVLVGDGTYDFKDYVGTGTRNYVPPYLAFVDPWLGETSTDNRYVSVSGGDILPDMHIGRLPVNTPQEAAAAISKTLAYEQSPLPGDWDEIVTFVADNADSAGNFAALSDDLVNSYLPPPYRANKIYLGRTCPYESPSTVCSQQIMDSVNVTGTLLLNFIGHAGTRFWTAEKLLGVADIPSLNNPDRYPVILAMTCYDGYFIDPQTYNTSTGEEIIRAEGKGAVATWSPSGLGVATGHHYLDKGFYDAVFHNGVQELGPATLGGKLRVYGSGRDFDLIETYHLFGDPALRLNLLRADVAITKTVDPPKVVSPGDPITYTLTYVNAGPATAFNVVISDVLPTEVISPSVTSSGAAITPRAGSRYVWDVADLSAGQGGTITITAVVSPGLGDTVLTNTATIESTGIENDGSDNIGSASIDVVKPIRQTYLPLAMREYVKAPDLVVESVLATEKNVQVVIRNQGTGPVRDEFWVDVYIDPDPAPTAVNQIWQGLSEQGVVWGIEGDALRLLDAGGLVTLTVGIGYQDDYVWPSLSHVSWPIPTGTPVYAQVDSANRDTDYGGVLETHEISGLRYNNIAGPVYSNVTTASSTAPPSRTGNRRWDTQGRMPPR